MIYQSIFIILTINLIESRNVTHRHVVYYKLPPFIYEENGTLVGMFPDIFKQALELCYINVSFTLDTGTVDNFKDLLNNSTKAKQYTGKEWMWIPLLEYVDEQKLNKLNLNGAPIFDSPGIEVVVNSHQLSIVKKMTIGVNNCRYLLVLAALSAVCYAVLIWMAVRRFYTSFKTKSLPNTIGAL